MYIKKNKPVVICINVVSCISQELIDYYAISHKSRFISESKLYKDLKKPIILPKCRFSQDELSELDDLNIIDYGLKIEKGLFKFGGDHTTAPYDITIAYLLGFILESKIKSLSVACFDGYPQDDIRQQEMIEVLNFYKDSHGSVEIVSLTPTTYPVIKSSVYAPVR